MAPPTDHSTVRLHTCPNASCSSIKSSLVYVLHEPLNSIFCQDELHTHDDEAYSKRYSKCPCFSYGIVAFRVSCGSQAMLQCCMVYTNPPGIQRSHLLFHLTIDRHCHSWHIQEIQNNNSNSSNNSNSRCSNMCQRTLGGCKASLASPADPFFDA